MRFESPKQGTLASTEVALVRRVSLSQFNAIVRQQQSKLRQAVNDYNRQVDRYNAARRQAVSAYNQWVRSYNAGITKTVNNYNQAVRSHNAQVQSRRQRLLSSLHAPRSTTTYSVLRTSSVSLNERFDQIDRGALPPDIASLAEREAANSLATARTFVDDLDEHEDDATSSQVDAVAEVLQSISSDLHSRWQGALYALNPRNPDAARHVCTSMREVLTQMLEVLAPDADVVGATPNSERVPNSSKPNRKSKVLHLLRLRDISNTTFENFVEEDMGNILQLFSEFNDATHGPAGRHGFAKLRAIKARVEGGIMFLAGLAIPSA